MQKTHRDHIIPHPHTLIELLHQKNKGVVEGTFHGTKVINLHEWKFYKKIVLQKGNTKKSEVMTQQQPRISCKWLKIVLV